ncbi:MAG: GNAT family N-acetyltransferase [Pseudomonadota bacterium]
MPEAQAEAAKLTISQFDKALHDRSAFSCGFEPIDRFLKDAMTDHVKAGYLVAFIATEEGRKEVIGFYTLNAFAVNCGHIETPKRPRPPPTIPATYMKAVAVHKEWQGKGIGRALMVHGLRQATEISEKVGSRAIVLDVLHDEAFDRRFEFYKGLGFRPMNDPENVDRVYITIEDIRATLYV